MSLTKKSLSGVRVRLAANIYKPNELSAKHKFSGILLVPGWAVSKVNLKSNYGPHFAELGFIVLAFDYKSWGESDGPIVPTEALIYSDEAAKLDYRPLSFHNLRFEAGNPANLKCRLKD